MNQFEYIKSQQVLRAKHILNSFKESQDIIQKSMDGEFSDLLKGDESEEQRSKVKKVMDEWKSGKLKSSSGQKVSDRQQAIAIALSEAGLSKK